MQSNMTDACDRVLTSDEIASFHSDPYQILNQAKFKAKPLDWFWVLIPALAIVYVFGYLYLQ